MKKKLVDTIKRMSGVDDSLPCDNCKHYPCGLIKINKGEKLKKCPHKK